jgi:hypothetical protein
MDNLPLHLARLAAHLLRARPSDAAAVARSQAAADHLAQVAGFMDNYMHPSNTGVFVCFLVRLFVLRMFCLLTAQPHT